MLQGVRSPAVGGIGPEHTKSNLDNIVGSLWQARQESSGSSRGDQVILPPTLLPPTFPAKASKPVPPDAGQLHGSQ
jgi:hypothetical protein